jgi:hypothetical protein
MASACLRDKRLNNREESLSPFTRLTATIDWYTGSFSDRLLERRPSMKLNKATTFVFVTVFFVSMAFLAGYVTAQKTEKVEW